MLDDDNARLWACLGRLSERCQRLLRIVAAEARPDYSVIATELGHAGGQHRPHPGSVPGQAASRARAGRGPMMSTDDDDHDRARRRRRCSRPIGRALAAGRPTAGRPGRRRARPDRRGGPRVRPADPGRVRGRAGRRTFRRRRRRGRGDEAGAWSLEYAGPDFRVYVRLTRIEDRTRLDGWVVPARPLTVRLLRRGPGRPAGDRGRRVRPLRVRRRPAGLARLTFVDEPRTAARPRITPPFWI